MNHQFCKHVNMNTGLHCDSNGLTVENRYGYCKRHYDMRMKLAEGQYPFTNGQCQNVIRGKQKYCMNTALPGLMDLCQTCYNDAKEKRQAEVIKNRELRNFERHMHYRIPESYQTITNQLLHDCRTRPDFDIIDEIACLYQYAQYDHLSSEEKRTIANRLVQTYANSFNLVLNQEDIEEYIRWNEDEDRRIFHPPPRVRIAPKLKTTILARIAGDNQNVHIKEVVEQSNAMVDKLLNLSLTQPKLDRVPDFFASKWLLRPWGTWGVVRPIVNDMVTWYNTSFCKAENDWLYKKVLNGLYVYVSNVKDDSMRRELRLRIFQECRESVGLCCEGHIARLANALVGFDEQAVPQVPTGEVLQQRMAAIAGMDIPPEEKYTKAKIVLAELNVPQAKQQEWLDAF